LIATKHESFTRPAHHGYGYMGISF